ncbi:MAG: UMP kinase [Nanoarchaeota archaeon]|nr:UMP kinase [Nanoarchaeota archaeon]
MKTIILSLGGSVIVPGDIDVKFLKRFRKIVLEFVKKGNRIVIITGGGKTARDYIASAEKITKLNVEDLDWIGIHSTRLNAHLLRTIFRDYSYAKIIKNPTEKIKTNKKIIIAAGWKPGCSTDYDGVLLAQNLKVKTMINMTNVNYVHDRNPMDHKNTKIIKELNWKQMKKIVGNKWSPGLNSPFDPEACKLAEKIGLKVIMIGKSIINFENLLNGKGFRGSVIE